MTANHRVRFSIARLMAAVLVSVLAFVLVRPFNFPIGSTVPIATVLAIGMLIPVFVLGLSWLDIAVIFAIALVLVALLMPSAPNQVHRKRAAARAAATARARTVQPSTGAPSDETAADAREQREGPPR